MLITKLVDIIQATKDQDAMGMGLLCTGPKQYLWESDFICKTSN